MSHHGVEQVLEHGRVEHGEDFRVNGAPPLVPRPRVFGGRICVGRVVLRFQDGFMLLKYSEGFSDHSLGLTVMVNLDTFLYKVVDT